MEVIYGSCDDLENLFIWCKKVHDSNKKRNVDNTRCE